MASHTETLVRTIFAKNAKLINGSTKFIDTTILAQLKHFAESCDNPEEENRFPNDAYQWLENFLTETKSQQKKGERKYVQTQKIKVQDTDKDGTPRFKKDGTPKMKEKTVKGGPKEFTTKALKKPATISVLCKRGLLYVLASLTDEVLFTVQTHGSSLDGKTDNELLDIFESDSRDNENAAVLVLAMNIGQSRDKDVMDRRVQGNWYSQLNADITDIITPVLPGATNKIVSIVTNLYVNFLTVFASKIANMCWHQAVRVPVPTLDEKSNDDEDCEMEWAAKGHTIQLSYLKEFMGYYDQVIDNATDCQHRYQFEMDEFIVEFAEQTDIKKAESAERKAAAAASKAARGKAKSAATDSKIKNGLDNKDEPASDDEEIVPDNVEYVESAKSKNKPRTRGRTKRSL